MIEDYFEAIEEAIQSFPHVRAYSLSKRIYNVKQGFIRGSILFENNSRLEFIEVKDTDKIGKIKYRYQYMDQQNVLIFRYDNAPHYSHISSFPHHKHIASGIVQVSHEPSLDEVLLEIARILAG